MEDRTALPLRVLTGAGVLPALLPGAVSALNTGSLQGFPFQDAAMNLAIAASVVILLIFGLYAYASLARFAPYHAWIYMYLISLTGIVWALFLARSGGSLPDAVFILITVIGLNLIVHILRFDRIEIPILSGAGYPTA